MTVKELIRELNKCDENSEIDICMYHNDGLDNFTYMYTDHINTKEIEINREKTGFVLVVPSSETICEVSKY